MHQSRVVKDVDTALTGVCALALNSMSRQQVIPCALVAHSSIHVRLAQLNKSGETLQLGNQHL